MSLPDDDQVEEMDMILVDLKRAVRALDNLPNTLIIQSHEVDIATVAVALAGVVKLLELENGYQDLATIRLLIAKSRLAFTTGDLAGAEAMNARAKELIDRLQGKVF